MTLMIVHFHPRMLKGALDRQQGDYIDPSVYADTARPPDPYYTDPYSYMMPVNRRNSMPRGLAPPPPRGNHPV